MGDQAPAPAAGGPKKKKSTRIKSALKRARQTPKKTAVNVASLSRVRTAVLAV